MRIEPIRGHRSLRRGRVSLPHQAYHLVIATQRRWKLFADWNAGRVVAHALNDRSTLGDACTLAWCLMPDHLHWLLQLGDEATLHSIVQRFKSRSTIAMNRRFLRRGAICETGYYHRALRAEDSHRVVARYIVANALQAGLVDDLGQYPLWDAIWLGDSSPL